MIRASVEQTEARIIGHESHGHDFPPGTPDGHGIASGGVRESNPHPPAWKTETLTVAPTPRKGNPRTSFVFLADSLADAAGFEPGSPPTGGGVLPITPTPRTGHGLCAFARP